MNPLLPTTTTFSNNITLPLEAQSLPSHHLFWKPSLSQPEARAVVEGQRTTPANSRHSCSPNPPLMVDLSSETTCHSFPPTSTSKSGNMRKEPRNLVLLVLFYNQYSSVRNLFLGNTHYVVGLIFSGFHDQDREVCSRRRSWYFFLPSFFVVFIVFNSKSWEFQLYPRKILNFEKIGLN